jgi:hypothetical protein
MIPLFRLSIKNFIRVVFLTGITGLSLSALADEPYIGMIKTYQPLASVLHKGVEGPVDVGSKLFAGDTVVTHADAAVGIIFMDGSVLSLGSESRFEIVDFLFKPAEREVSFISKVTKGTVAFSSGAIGRISPESVKFITPTSTLGLHGTKILIEVK